MRGSRTVVTALVATLALAGCAEDAPAAPGPDASPTAVHSRAVASDYRCLADHSPWALDLDAVYRAWSEAAEAEHELRGGTITGTATLSFTRTDERRWSSTASSVAFELFFADGARETTTLDHRLSGDYLVAEPGGVLELLSHETGTSATDAVSIAADGTRAEGTRVAAPRFPWDADAGTVLHFACTEHRLLVSAPGETPETWDLSPG